MNGQDRRTPTRKRDEPVETVRERTIRRRARLRSDTLRMRSLYVSDETWEALREQAADKGTTLSALVRDVLAGVTRR